MRRDLFHSVEHHHLCLLARATHGEVFFLGIEGILPCFFAEDGGREDGRLADARGAQDLLLSGRSQARWRAGRAKRDGGREEAKRES